MEIEESYSPELLGYFCFPHPKVHGVGTVYLRVVQGVCCYRSGTDLAVHWVECWSGK